MEGGDVPYDLIFMQGFLDSDEVWVESCPNRLIVVSSQRAQFHIAIDQIANRK